LQRTPGLRAFAALLLCCGFSQPAWSDLWFDYRVAAGEERLGLVLQGSRPVNDQTHTIRLNIGTCLFICSSFNDFDEVSTLSYLVGYRQTGTAYIATYQAGLGLVYGEQEDDCVTGVSCREELGLGVPLTVSFTFGRYVGFGAGLFANLNTVESIAGISFGWTFGKFN
jgi:hypothetical protein